jgi:hypothetical protein
MRTRLVALVAAIPLVASACTGGSPGGHGAAGPAGHGGASSAPAVDQPGNIPDAAALKRVAAGLPADPAAAASALADKIFAGDGKTAAAATGELLRRAGLPLGSGKGPIVALPDGVTIVNAQLGVELLPALAEQVREGMQFDLSQVLAALAHVGVPEAKLTAAQLVGTLAEWGKGAKDLPAAQYAGAAERALAAHHGQLFAQDQLLPAATATALQDKPQSLRPDAYQRAVAVNPPALDPIQLILLVAHAGSHATTKPVVKQVPPTPRPGPSGGHSLTESVALPSCGYVNDQFDGESGGAAKATAKAILQDALKEAAEERYGVKVKNAFDKGFEAYDKVTDVLSYLAFTAAIRFDVEPKNRKSTHFLHDEGDHANDVQFEAHAYFKAIVPKEWEDCFALAGIGLPTDKDLEEMKVIWTLPNGKVALKPAAGLGVRQFDYPLLLDKQGRSVVTTTPRRELHPPKNGEKKRVSTAYQQVKASLDKNYLAVHASDFVPLLFGVEGIPAVIVGIAYNNIVGLIKEMGLPEKTIDFPVTYHGDDVYRIYGNGYVNIIFTGNIHYAADLVSCDGPQGRWQGSVTVSGALDAVLAHLGHAMGASGPSSGSETVKAIPFLLNVKTDQPQKFVFNDRYGLIVELDRDAIDSDFTEAGPNGQPQRMLQIGVAAGTIGGQDLRVLGGFLGPLFSAGLELPVEAVDGGDLRCPGTALYDNPFD